MQNWNVAVDNDSFKWAGITTDCQEAICEYIWNGFEAGASKVSVKIINADLDKAPVVIIQDNGSGIAHSTVRNTFGGFCHHKRSR